MCWLTGTKGEARDGSVHGSSHSVLELSRIVAAVKLQDPDGKA